MPEQPPTQTSGNWPQIMLSAIEGYYNQWKGDVFTLHHLGGDAALQLEIAPIHFEGYLAGNDNSFGQVSFGRISTQFF